MRRWLQVWLLGVILLAISGCGLAGPTATPTPEPGYSKEELEAYLELAQPLLDEFNDTLEIAGSTARIALAPVVSELRRIQREFRRLECPEIAKTAHAYFSDGMDFGIQAFLAFMAQESDAEVERLFKKGREAMDKGIMALNIARVEAR